MFCRKTESVKFPEMGDRTFEKFVRFVEAHKTNPVTKDGDCFNAQVSLNYLKRNLNSVKIENLNLRRRLKREILTRNIAERGGSNVERLLNKKNKMLSDSEAKLMNLWAENRKLLQQVLAAKRHLRKYRRMAEMTLAELKQRNWELHSTILSLEEANSKLVDDSDKSSTHE